jgi:hypothetical protein
MMLLGIPGHPPPKKTNDRLNFSALESGRMIQTNQREERPTGRDRWSPVRNYDTLAAQTQKISLN